MHLLDETAQATLAGVSGLRRSLRRCLSELRLPEQVVDDLQIAVAELGSNVVAHGVPSASTLHMRISLERDLLRVDLEDDGGAFVPLEQALHDAPSVQNVARLSGMGLDFVREGIDTLQYRPGRPNRTVLLRRLHGRRRRILLIEDDPVLRELYGEMLVRQFECCRAASLAEARLMAEREPPDLIIADLHLEDGKGNEASAWLDPSGGAPAPLIILTADKREGVQAALVREGVDACLAKPVSARDLLAAARGALTRTARQRTSALAGVGALLHLGGIGVRDVAHHGWKMIHAGEAAGLGSGDFILALEGRNRTRIVLADAMGHGLKAAISTLALTGALRAVHTLAGESPRAFLSALNRAMVADQALGDLFATVLVVDLMKEGQVEIATAGHPAPMILSGGTVRRVQAEGVLPGLVAEAVFTTANVTLHPGERLLLVTDGLEPAGIGAPGDLPPWLTAAATGSLSSPLEAAAAAIVAASRAQPVPEAADDWTFVLLEPMAAQPAAR